MPIDETDKGFIPRTPADMAREDYETWKQYPGNNLTWEQWYSTNMHKYLSTSVYPSLERVEGEIVALNISMGTYWYDNNMAVKNSYGSSREGWYALFADVTTGIKFINQEEDPTLILGEFRIFFDNLTLLPVAGETPEQIEEKRAKLEDKFRRCIQQASRTVADDPHETIAVNYADGKQIVYKFTNLKPENYTPVDFEITIIYVDDAPESNTQDIIDDFKAAFKKLEYIGRAIYPHQIMPTEKYPNIAEFRIRHRVNEGSWSADIRPSEWGQKFIVSSNIIVNVL